MATYPMHVAGLDRDFPICKVTDDLYIGAFIMFGDAELTVRCAEELLKLAEGIDYDVGNILRRAGCAVTDSTSVNSDYSALTLVGQERGVTILPRMLLGDYDDQRIQLRYLEGHPTRTICLATLPQRRLSPAAELFCRYTTDMFHTSI